VRSTRTEDLGRYDCLYVAVEASHALLSCPARIAAETGKGQKVLIASLFGPSPEAGGQPSAAGLGRLGVDVYEAGLPPAPERSGLYRSCAGRVFNRDPADEECLDQASHVLGEVGRRTRARHVCIPLGVGGHIDHRLAHEAAVRSFGPEAERDVLFYEDRPPAFVPGAVRIRLAHLGARLPPAAQAAASSGLARFLVRQHTAPHLWRQIGGVSERLRFTRLAFREWRSARAWDPRRSLGPRVQPVLVEGDGGAAVLRELLADEARFQAHLRRAGQYGKSLGEGASAERYWLLLPSRDEEGLTLPSPA
jgi:hypothetical protein